MSFEARHLPCSINFSPTVAGAAVVVVVVVLLSCANAMLPNSAVLTRAAAIRLDFMFSLHRLRGGRTRLSMQRFRGTSDGRAYFPCARSKASFARCWGEKGARASFSFSTRHGAPVQGASLRTVGPVCFAGSEEPFD